MEAAAATVFAPQPAAQAVAGPVTLPAHHPGAVAVVEVTAPAPDLRIDLAPHFANGSPFAGVPPPGAQPCAPHGPAQSKILRLAASQRPPAPGQGPDPARRAAGPAHPARRPTLRGLPRDLPTTRSCSESLCGPVTAELCRGAKPWPPAAPNPATQWAHPHADRGRKTVGPPIFLQIQRACRMAQAPSQKVESARVCARPGGHLSGAPARL